MWHRYTIFQLFNPQAYRQRNLRTGKEEILQHCAVFRPLPQRDNQQLSCHRPDILLEIKNHFPHPDHTRSFAHWHSAQLLLTRSTLQNPRPPPQGSACPSHPCSGASSKGCDFTSFPALPNRGLLGRGSARASSPCKEGRAPCQTRKLTQLTGGLHNHWMEGRGQEQLLSSFLEDLNTLKAVW